jgi:hypothetical protein
MNGVDMVRRRGGIRAARGTRSKRAGLRAARGKPGLAFYGNVGAAPTGPGARVGRTFELTGLLSEMVYDQ